jgi:uncharacterized protein
MRPNHLNRAEFRFYQSLNDFLPLQKRQRCFQYLFEGRPGVKDVIESIGVPHVEVDRIVVDKHGVDFSYHLLDGDRVAVYPWFRRLVSDPNHTLRQNLILTGKFILDVHLGKLCRYMRLLGLDCIWRKALTDAEIVRMSAEAGRIILTRDIALLKRKEAIYGYWVRSTLLYDQIREVTERFELFSRAHPFSRCTVCNGNITRTDKTSVKETVPEKIYGLYEEFFRCSGCHRIYWKGSHYDRMKTSLEQTFNTKSKK